MRTRRSRRSRSARSPRRGSTASASRASRWMLASRPRSCTTTSRRARPCWPRRSSTRSSAPATPRTADTDDPESLQRLRDMVEQCLPLPGEQEKDWVLWVELWLRAVRHPELRPTARSRMHTLFIEAIEAGDFDVRRRPRRRACGRAARRARAAGAARRSGDAGSRERAKKCGTRLCASSVLRRPSRRVGFLNRRSENSMSPRPPRALAQAGRLTAAARSFPSAACRTRGSATSPSARVPALPASCTGSPPRTSCSWRRCSSPTTAFTRI